MHRDVKPANVILAPSGPRVLDFGIAHALDGTAVTRTGTMTGTAGWISPEYYRTGVAGPAGDVFAWGALIGYAATGRLPFGVGAPDVVAFRVMSGEPDLAGVPDDLLALVTSALAKEPGDRPSATALASACTRLLASQTTQVLSPHAVAPTVVGDLIAARWDPPARDEAIWTPAEQDATRRRRRLSAVAGITTLALVTGGAAVLLDHPPRDGPPSGPDAEGARNHHTPVGTAQAPARECAGMAIHEVAREEQDRSRGCRPARRPLTPASTPRGHLSRSPTRPVVHPSIPPRALVIPNRSSDLRSDRSWH